jgi:hypothetical protein
VPGGAGASAHAALRAGRATLAALRALVMGDVQSSGLEWLGTEASGL